MSNCWAEVGKNDITDERDEIGLRHKVHFKQQLPAGQASMLRSSTMQAQLTRYWFQYFVLWVQVFIAVGVFVVFSTVPRLGERFFRPVESFYSNFASRRATAVWSVFLATIVLRVMLFPAIGVPFPDEHDERSYLLMAETFAHGPLAYPPHPLWKSFETFHVNSFPTYSSVYPPAQGAVLALGIILGHPWIGVLLSVAAMCAAVVWMLQAWMPSRWAFLGGVITLCNLGVVSYWVNSYWGGAVAATGGALLLGALPRIFRTQRVRYSLLLGLGVAILANSRPYEGLLLCIPAAAWLLFWLAGRSSPPLRETTPTVLLPIAGVLALTAVFMAYYNWRLTGNALLMPHVLSSRTHGQPPVFLWQHAGALIHCNNKQFDDFYNGWSRSLYNGTIRDLVRVSREKARTLTAAFLWPGAFPALFCLPLALRDRRMRLLFVELLCLAGMFSVIYFEPHYAAPLTCVIYGLIVQGIRHLRTIRIGTRPAGIGLARASILLLLLTTGFNAYHLIQTPAHAYSWSWNRGTGNPGTAEIERQLDQIPGQHLIVVRYGATHNPHGEYVFNHADIDASRIVWARELDPQQNDKLFAYFKDRQFWLLEPDSNSETLKPLHVNTSRPVP